MIDSFKSYWTAFYTKPRNEIKAANRLIGQGFEVYCPTRTVVKQWSDRKKRVKEPIFSSYLFAKVNESSRSEILRDNGIVSNVFWLGMPAVIRECEILAIRSFLEDYSQIKTSFDTGIIGSKVLVDSGPLSGQTGVVKRVKGNRVCLNIVSLGIEMHAEIRVGHLKPVS